MTQQLVLLKNGSILCDSQMVARKFNAKHRDVVRMIKKLISDLEQLRVVSNHPKIIEKVGEYRGTKFIYYELDKRAFSLLAMRFKTKEAFEWQNKFNDAFYEMERSLIQLAQNQQSDMWLAQREQAKQLRKEETDIIKQFIDYATAQGSVNAQFYYKHITTAVYKCLDLIQYKQPKLRETLDLMQTSQLILAEMTARKSLIKYMDDGEHYKAIFSLVKRDLETFANSFLSQPMISKPLE